MKKKYIRLLSIILGVLFLLLIIANFGLNLWLKYKLPDYVKNHTAYVISYKTLDVHMGTGNIISTGIAIKNKDPQNLKTLGLQGSADTLSIARFDIYDALFNNEIKTSSLTLKNPNLIITLPKPGETKKGKKSKPLLLDLLRIDRGNISVYRHSKQKFLGISDLNLQIEDLQMTEETRTGKIPFSFSKYNINGKNVFFRPDNVYAFTVKYMTTKEGQLSLKEFALNPLLSYQNFTKFFPKKRNLFDVKISEMEFQDFLFKNDQITLTKVRLEKPVIKMFTTRVKPSKREKSFTYDVLLEDLIMNKARIEILKPNGQQLFRADPLDMSINKFLMNAETAKGNIPFQYDHFKIAGKKIHYISDTQKVVVGDIKIDPKSAHLENISVKPASVLASKSSLDLQLKKLQLQIKEWKFIDSKLSLNIDHILVDNLKGKITSAKNPVKKKATFSGIHFPLMIKNVDLRNADLIIESKNQPLHFRELQAKIQNIEMNATTVKDAIPFKTGSYQISSKNFLYKTKFYNLSTSSLKINKNALEITNFAMKPTVSRAQFIRMIPTEKDLYDLKVKDIKMTGTWDLLSSNKFLHASNVVLEGMSADIFRSKIPQDDLTIKPMYSKLLRSIKFPLLIDDLFIKNSLLIYEEDTKKSDGPGKLTFTDFNLNAKNINSGKMKGKPTKVPITITCKLMGSSPMKINWNLDTASQSDAFSIAGTVTDIPAPHINAFTEPYLKIRATGLISYLDFDFKGDKSGIGGDFKMKNQDLKIEILKADGEKNTLLSGVANLLLKSTSDQFPEAVPVKNVERNNTKSFFNLLWQGIEQGLKRTLIGINAPETEEKIKKAVDNTKDAVNEVKSEIKEVKKDIKEEKTEVKKEIKDVRKEIKKDRMFKKNSRKNRLKIN